MCVYCVIGDWQFRHNPPWKPTDYPVWPPSIPVPPAFPQPFSPWPVEQVREYLELLEKVKALEDQLGCPCEPNKADYIGLLKKRVAALEKKSKKSAVRPTPGDHP